MRTSNAAVPEAVENQELGDLSPPKGALSLSGAERQNLERYSDQLRQYPGGLEGWQADFVRRGDLDYRTFDLPSGETRAGFCRQVLDKLLVSNTRFARMSRLLAATSDDVAIPFRLMLQFWNDPTQLTSQLNSLSLKGILVDPDRIVELADNLGFLTEGKPAKKRAECGRPHVIESVKLALETANRFDCGQRVLLLRKASEDECARYPSARELESSKHGTLIFVCESTISGEFHRTASNRRYHPLAAQSHDIYSLSRRSAHQSRWYNVEVVELAEMEAEFSTIVMELEQWRAGTSLEEKLRMRSDLSTRLEQVQAALHGTFNLEKKKMFDHIATAISLLGTAEEDQGLTRLYAANPRAARATVFSAEVKSAIRSQSIGFIDGYNRNDVLSLTRPTKKAEKLFTYIHEKLVARDRDSEEYAVRQFVDGNAVTEYGLSRLGLRLDFSDACLRVRPFLTFARELQRGLAIVEGATREKHRQRICEGLVLMTEAVRFQQLNEAHSHLLEVLVHPASATIDSLNGKVTRMREVLASKPPFEALTGTMYGHVHSALRTAVDKIGDDVKKYIEETPTPALRKEKLEAFKKKLKEHNFEQMVAQGILRT